MNQSEKGTKEGNMSSSDEEEDDIAGEGGLKSAYSVTDLLDELDSEEEIVELKDGDTDHLEHGTDNTAHIEVTQSETMDNNNDKSNLMKKQINNTDVKPLEIDNQRTAQDSLQPKEPSEKCENHTLSGCDDSGQTLQVESIECPEKVSLKDDPSVSSEEEDSSIGKEDSVWKRKKVVKKRRFRSENKSPSSESAEADVTTEDASTDKRNGKSGKRSGYENVELCGENTISNRKRSGYENVEIPKKASGYENVDMDIMKENRLKSGDPVQVTQKRITTDISGRMVITGGSIYTDTDEYSKKVQTLERSVDAPYDNNFENVRTDVVILEEEEKDGYFEDGEGEDDMYENVIVDSGLREVEGDEQNSNTGSKNSLYDTYDIARKPSNTDDDMSWGSSEFSSYDEDEDRRANGTFKGQQLIAATVEYKVKEQTPQSGGNVLDKLAAKLGHRPKSVEVDDNDIDSFVVEVTLDLDKHPPPELGPAPEGLSAQQIKRRYIVGSIVESETSYFNSLRRLIQEYEKPLREAKPPIIGRKAINTIFFKIREILQCHNMFHIELAECINVWDEQEEIGNVFTASFSKSMVFDAYSEFVNNHSLAMDTVKLLARQKPAFADFLKQRITSAKDRLSLFGLIVKPVQRFPQFILLLQDLLKHTAKNHHDRLSLQLALTELETLTHRLNESKRESEAHNDAKHFTNNLMGRHSVKWDAERYQVRRDNLYQVVSVNGMNKTKLRALFLLNDQLICASVVEKEGGADVVERYKYKWSVPVKDVCLVDTEIVTPYEIKMGPGRTTIVSPKLDSSTYNPWKKDVDDMLHDLPIIEQISQLISQLRLPYHDLKYEYAMGIHRALQMGIRQSSDLDKCVLHLSVPAKGSNRVHYTFQLGSPSLKQEWVMDLRHTKLALDKNNKPGWLIPESEYKTTTRIPVFVKPLLLDVTKQENKFVRSKSFNERNKRIQCAIPIILPSEDGVYGIQHLWICSNDAKHCQVAIVSLHTAQPHVIESFRASDAIVTCAELVPGSSFTAKEHGFDQDTVWMATEENEICVHHVCDEERHEPELTFDTDGKVTCMKYLNGLLYAGLEDGRLAIYRRDHEGAWNIAEPILEDLSTKSITCLHAMGSEMWAASGGNIYQLIVKSHSDGAITVEKATVEVSSKVKDEICCMATAGVGLLVSFKDNSVIRIFHLETFKHLQDANLASNINKLFGDKELPPEISNELGTVSVTFLLASRGLLWVGTSLGCVLTFPLPRLEGVPQIKGRPNVSYHAHMGPIKFLTPIYCGASPLPVPSLPTSPVHSAGNPSARSSFADSCEDRASMKASQDNVLNFHLDGVTESCSEDTGYIMSEYNTENTSIDDRFTASDHLGTLRRFTPYEPINKNKWLSTPDLRSTHDSVYSNEDDNDVSSLYRNLLSGTDHEELDNELLESRFTSKKKRPFSAMPFSHKEEMRGRRMMMMRRGSKYSTLPILVEDTHGKNGAGEKKRHSVQYPGQLDLLGDSFDTSFQDDSQELQNEDDAANSISLDSSMEASTALGSLDATSPLSPVTPDSPSLTGQGLLGNGTVPSIYRHPVFSQSSSVESTVSQLESPKPPPSPQKREQFSVREKTPPTRASRPSSLKVGSPTSAGPGSPPATNAQVKSMIIVSGGDGHINWSLKKPGDSRYEDICLLLWQYRL